MLVLTRKVGEEIVLPNRGVTVGVVGINGKHVWLGITAPLETSVHRKEVWQRIRQPGECGRDGSSPDCEHSQADSVGAAILNDPPIGQPQSNSPEIADDGSNFDWQQEVRRRIAARTHGRVFGVEVEVIDERVIVRGRSASYHGKQLACVAARELLDSLDSAPFRQVELDIEVVGG